MRILEEFWYGNIEPTEYDTSSCKEYKKLLELICRNEEKLQATMTDEQKDLFEKYADCVREYQTITDCLVCIWVIHLTLVGWRWDVQRIIVSMSHLFFWIIPKKY